MGITIDNVLQRMQAELNRAQGTGSLQKKREHLAAMKTLCELALENDVEAEVKPVISNQPTGGYQATTSFVSPNQAPPPPVSNFQTKPIKEDDANGDSLFDF